MPSLSMLPVFMERVRGKRRKLFYDMSEYAMIRIREKISIERKIFIEKLKQKGK